jgi:hypothetical protein
VQYFKHFTSMRHDVKIRRLISRYGIEGYGLYCLILESIVEKLTTDSPSPDLQETCEDIADFYNGNTAKVNEIASFMVNQGLLEVDDVTTRITCHKVYKFLEQNQTRSEEIRKLISSYREGNYQSTETVSRPSETKVIEKEKNKNRIRIEKKETRKAYGSEKNVYLSDEELEKLYSEFSRTLVDKKIEDMSLYCKTHGKHYKSYKAALLLWLRKDDKPSTDTSKPKTHTVKPCPECGDLLKMGYCPKCDKDYNGVEL